jgi:hypothetical protein
VKLPLPVGLPPRPLLQPLFRRHPACPRKSRPEAITHTCRRFTRRSTGQNQTDCGSRPRGICSAVLRRPVSPPPNEQSERDQRGADEEYE